MLVDPPSPEFAPGSGVDRIHAPDEVGEKSALGPAAGRRNQDRRAHLGSGFEAPANAAALCVERIHHPVLAADVERPVGEGRAGTGANRGRIGECPFEREARNVGGSKFGNVAGDEMRVFGSESPADDIRFMPEIEARRTSAALRRHRGLRRAERRAREIFGDIPLIGVRQGGGLRFHDAEGERTVDGLRGHHLDECS